MARVILTVTNSGSCLVAIAHGAVAVTGIGDGDIDVIAHGSEPLISTVRDLSDASEIHNSTKVRTIRLVPGSLHLWRVRRGQKFTRSPVSLVNMVVALLHTNLQLFETGLSSTSNKDSQRRGHTAH
jgi:hypothetical protein